MGAVALTGSAACALSAAVPFLRPALVTPAAQRRLLGAAEAAPPASGGIIECHAADPDRADLGVRYLATELPSAAGHPALAGWGRALQRLWAPMQGRLRVTWLELDVCAGVAPVAPVAPVASAFAGPGCQPSRAADGAPSPAEWAAILAALWPAAPPSAAASVQRLRQALPSGAWLGYLGFMRGRVLRATVCGLQAEGVPSLLRALGWPGEPSRLAGALDAAGRCDSRLTLALDLADGCGARLGVELASACWARLIAAVGEAAPLAPDAQAALLEWPGVSGAGVGQPATVRRLNHVKLSFDGVAPPALKAYLYYGTLPPA